MKGLRTNRRKLLAGAGLGFAGSALSTMATGPVSTVAGEAVPTVILQDRRLELPDDVRRRLAGNGARIVVLAEDPVRMWRGELAPLLTARETRLLGVTSWPQFLMVRGLAEESGRRVRYQRFDAASGAIVWLIA